MAYRPRPHRAAAHDILDSGGHNLTTWQREVAPTLEWIGGRLDAG
ncbi:hypothetical protein ACFU51_27170 [Streptomyces sp. NPDC057430]